MSKLSPVEKAAEILKKGELVAIPTETVYGLAANAFSDIAIGKIYSTKNRPANNPLIVHTHSIDQLKKIAINIPEMAYTLAEHFWPGPLTLVLEKAPHISEKVTAGKNTVAVRIPDHPLTLELLRNLDFPLVAPSANRSNHISPTCPAHVRSSLGDKTPFILEGGNCKKGIESTILGFDKGQPVIYRLGTVSRQDIEKVLGCGVELFSKDADQIIAPGMFKKHYSPKTPFIATTHLLTELANHGDKKLGVISYTVPEPSEHSHLWRLLSPQGNEAEAASRLYAIMHELDQEDLDLIIAEYLPDTGIGASVNDRLKRASSK